MKAIKNRAAGPKSGGQLEGNGQRGSSQIIQKSMSWSFFSEVTAKFITPVTNMILARLLMPDDFGVLAVCNMVVSFVDIITDAGFSKYLVQHDFSGEEEKYRYANVAFWSNLALSALLFLFIVLDRHGISAMLGSPEYSTVIAVACVQLLFTSLSSIQMGLFRRTFDFQKLFAARIAVAAAPLVFTVPLAFATRSYWSLIIGNLAGALLNAVILTAMSDWKPGLYYSFELLKKMFSFSFWSLCEGLANWFIFWFDTFLATNAFSKYYVGIYKNSANMVMSLMGMISASMSPVLLAVLSRVKQDREAFQSLFLTIQRVMLYIIIPMGLGLFCYRGIVTRILFGGKWGEAADVVGAWGLMMAVSVIFYSFTAELYKAGGIPKFLFIFQLLYLAVLLPVCAAATRYGFWTFVYVRCACIVWQVAVSLVFLKIFFAFPIGRFLANLVRPALCATVIPVTWLVFRHFFGGYVSQFFFMALSALAYFAVLFLFFRRDVAEAVRTMQAARLGGEA